MKNQKNELATLSPEQRNPYLCDPRDWEVVENGVPFHKQCGSNEREYKQLLAESEKGNIEGEVHPDVNRAGKPRTRRVISIHQGRSVCGDFASR